MEARSLRSSATSVGVAAALLGILTLAFLLRWWGWDYGLPHPTARPDEEVVVNAVYQMFASRDPEPLTVGYPSGPFPDSAPWSAVGPS